MWVIIKKRGVAGRENWRIYDLFLAVTLGFTLPPQDGCSQPPFLFITQTHNNNKTATGVGALNYQHTCWVPEQITKSWWRRCWRQCCVVSSPRRTCPLTSCLLPVSMSLTFCVLALQRSGSGRQYPSLCLCVCLLPTYLMKHWIFIKPAESYYWTSVYNWLTLEIFAISSWIRGKTPIIAVILSILQIITRSIVW